MATIDLGKISFTQKGTWASGTAYTAKDVVQYTDGNDTSSYVAIASSTGQAPSTNGTLNSSNWVLMAKGAAIGSTYQSTYAGGTTYNKGDVVQYTDTGVLSTFIFVNTTPTAGQTPSTGGTVNTTYWSLIAKGTASVAISWQSTAKTANFTASASEGYFVDTNSNTVTVTTPSSPSVGDEFIITDLRGTFGTNKVIFSPNGSDKIKGATIDVEVIENYASVRVVYSGATYGWIPVSSSATNSEPLTASYNIQYLLVAGGGGGGGDNGGGGGAGGMRFNTSRDFSIQVGTQYTVTVGSGGLGGSNDSANSGYSGTTYGASGGDSIFSTITAAGGGGGGSAGTAGQNGGSGGGGAQNTAGGNGNIPSVSPSQGNNGGTSTAGDSGGAGGGGAGAAGTNTGGEGSNGGAGSANSITGSSVTYAGGGGGGERQSDNGVAGSGGSGGGANGSTSVGTGNSGTNGLGGGGGGGAQDGAAIGGTGGSGVVILRMLTSDYSGTTTGSPTVTTTGSGASEETILKWTASGSYTA